VHFSGKGGIYLPSYGGTRMGECHEWQFPAGKARYQ
jgi:hypothetical protein